MSDRKDVGIFRHINKIRKAEKMCPPNERIKNKSRRHNTQKTFVAKGERRTIE